VEPWVHGYSLHTIGWIISGGFAIFASLIAFYLIIKHATHYSVPTEQRHVIRILLLIPVYALVSWASYVWYWYAIYWEVARDCYEAFVIATFFALLCQYIAPSLEEQKEYFRRRAVPEWPWPVTWMNQCCCGIWRARSGLSWFNINYIGVYQYIFFEVATTIVSMATEVTNTYCEDSDSPRWAHIWMIAVSCVSVSFAMYFLIAFYVGLRTELSPHRPFLKLLSIKLVIFFSFWQEIVIDLLVSEKVIKPSQFVSYGDIYTGLNTFLICIEMTFFAILHIWSFSWKEYTVEGIIARNSGPTSHKVAVPPPYYGFWHAIGDALNPLDLLVALGRGTKWLFGKHSFKQPVDDKSAGNWSGTADVEMASASSGTAPMVSRPKQR